MTNNDFKKMLDEALKPVKEEQAELKDIIETRVLPPLTYIETKIQDYADMYKINDSNIRRMETLEEDAGVDVPPEFKLEPLPVAP